MGTQLATKSGTLETVNKTLGTLLAKHANALPKGFNETRFLQNCLTVLNDTKEIEKCEPLSIARCMIKGAYLGLDFFNGECYAIAYKGVIKFQTDYKGERKLAYKYGVNGIKDIYAKVVRKGDDFTIEIKNGQQVVNFIPVPFSDEEITGCFAIVYYNDGSMAYDAMSIAEIELTRKNHSSCPNSPAWLKNKGEMYKKTVMRRLLKTVDLSFDNQEQQSAFIDGDDFDKDKANKPVEVVVENPFTDVEVVPAVESIEAPATFTPPTAEEVKEAETPTLTPTPKKEENDNPPPAVTGTGVGGGLY